MNSMTLYWILKLDDICESIVILLIVSVVMVIIMVGWFVIARVEDTDYKPKLRLPVIAGIITALLFAFYTFLPTTKQLCIMYGVPALLESKVSADAQEVYELGIERLKRELEATGQELYIDGEKVLPKEKEGGE